MIVILCGYVGFDDININNNGIDVDIDVDIKYQVRDIYYIDSLLNLMHLYIYIYIYSHNVFDFVR